MVDTTVHTLSVLFAIVSGTGAGLLAVLCWRSFSQSPLGTVVAVLSATMSAVLAYHVVLFSVAPGSLLVDALRSSLYTVIAASLWLVLLTHQRIEHAAAGGEQS